MALSSSPAPGRGAGLVTLRHGEVRFVALKSAKCAKNANSSGLGHLATLLRRQVIRDRGGCRGGATPSKDAQGAKATGGRAGASFGRRVAARTPRRRPSGFHVTRRGREAGMVTCASVLSVHPRTSDHRRTLIRQDHIQHRLDVGWVVKAEQNVSVAELLIG